MLHIADCEDNWLHAVARQEFTPSSREADVPIYLHTDGHILEIIPDLIEVGVRMLNPQICANGFAGLVELAKGKVAIHIDLDRQLFPFATPAQIEEHIGAVVDALYLP